jgi:hypothetical protein
MIPEPIYKALPYIYALGGLASLFNFDPTIGKISGVLLISASLIIFKLRSK